MGVVLRGANEIFLLVGSGIPRMLYEISTKMKTGFVLNLKRKDFGVSHAAGDSFSVLNAVSLKSKSEDETRRTPQNRSCLK